MHRRHLWIIVALLIIVAILAFLLYRREKTHTFSFDITGVVGTATQGDTLEWRPAWFTSEFEIVFWASTPCVDESGNPEQKVRSKHGVASCRVGHVPDGKNYGYNLNLLGGKSEQTAACKGCSAVVVPKYPCKGCILQTRPLNPNGSYRKLSEQATSPVDATAVLFTCSNGKFGVTGPEGNVSVISWKPDATGTSNWHVTFPSDAKSNLCFEGTDFHDGLDTCTVKSPPLAGKNYFRITSTECPSDPTLFPAPSQ